MWAAPPLQAGSPKSALAAPALLGSSLPKAPVSGPWCSPAVLITEAVHSHNSSEAQAGSFAGHLLDFFITLFITKIMPPYPLLFGYLFWHKKVLGAF